MVAWRYGIPLLVFNSIPYEWAQRTSETDQVEHSKRNKIGVKIWFPWNSAQYIEVELSIYIVQRKKQINYKFILTDLFRGRPLIPWRVGDHDTGL